MLSTEPIVTALPPKPLADEYLRLFRNMPLRLVFPVIDVVLFQATIDSAYDPDDAPVSSIACVFSFLSILSHTQWAPKSSGLVVGDTCSRQAAQLMGLVTSEASIVELQVYIMQCMYQLFSGNLKSAIMYHALACRILFMLGGQFYPDPMPRESNGTKRREQVQLRKLF